MRTAPTSWHWASLAVIAALPAGLFTPAPLTAQVPDTIVLVEDEFTEAVLATLPVSGGTLAGVMSGDPDASIGTGTFSVLLPSGASGHLCVAIDSVDGRYRARIDRDLEGDSVQGGSGVRLVRFRSQHPEQWEARTATSFAILARLAPNCDESPDSYLLASWESTVDPGSPWVLANVGTFEGSVVHSADGGGVSRTPCIPLTAPRRTVFDVRCPVSLDPARSPPEDLRIERRRLSSRLPSVAIPLRWE